MFSDDGKYGVPTALSVFEPLENEHDRRVTWDMSVLGKKRVDGTLMDRFAGKVGGAHQGRVELAVAESSNRELERAHS